MMGAFYSKCRARKDDFIQCFLEKAQGGSAIYVYPKNRRKEAPGLPGVYSVTYEDVTKTEEWLHINAIAGQDSVLVLENPSRYPKITSQKFGYLKRLSMNLAHKLVVDIVPFTLDIQYLYVPLAYLDRSILGYAHYYAFRENYYEQDEAGVIHSAHDFDVLADKMKSTCRIDYEQFLCPNRQVIPVQATVAEHQTYAERREALFAKEKTPQRIVTRLADTAHAFESRQDVLLDLLSSLSGETIIYTNLGGYAKRIQEVVREAGFKQARAVSYQAGWERPVENCIYYESPIVKSYFLLDAESRLSSDSKVFHFLGDTKVDIHLYGLIEHELSQINGLTGALWEASNGMA